MVGGRARTKLVDGALGQVELVRAVLIDEAVDVSGVLWFIDADWPLVGAFFSTRDVRVVSPRKVSKLLAEVSGEMDVETVRDRLARAFPTACGRSRTTTGAAKRRPLVVPRMFLGNK